MRSVMHTKGEGQTAEMSELGQFVSARPGVPTLVSQPQSSARVTGLLKKATEDEHPLRHPRAKTEGFVRAAAHDRASHSTGVGLAQVAGRTRPGWALASNPPEVLSPSDLQSGMVSGLVVQNPTAPRGSIVISAPAAVPTIRGHKAIGVACSPQSRSFTRSERCSGGA